MPYYLIETAFIDNTIRRLSEGDIQEGKIGGKTSRIEILDEGSLSINGVVLSGEGGAVIFDKNRKFLASNRLIAYLTMDQAKDIDRLKASSELEIIAPGAFQDVISGVARLAKEQAGDPNASRWGIGRLFSTIFTNNLTERYSKQDE